MGLRSSSRQPLLLQPLTQPGHGTSPQEAGLKPRNVNWRNSQCRGVARTGGSAAVGNMQSHAASLPSSAIHAAAGNGCLSCVSQISGRRRAACCTGETLCRRWDMSCVAAHSCGWMRQVGLRRNGKRHTRGGRCWYAPFHGTGGYQSSQGSRGEPG